MAQKYRKVDPRIWSDEKFRKLNAEGKALALWMLTGTRINRCGILLWSPGLASEETGIPSTRIDTVCHTVCHTLSWVEDTVSRTVFLRRWWRYNKPDNIKAFIGALSDFHDVPENGLRSSLVEAAQDLPDEWHVTYFNALDTVCNTVSDTVSDTVSPQEQEQEQEQYQKQEPPKSPEGDLLQSFEKLTKLWNAIKGITHCKDASKARLRAFKARMETDGWRSLVAPALDAIKVSSFCRGENDRGWKSDIDWFLRPDTALKLCEGKYADKQASYEQPDDFSEGRQ